MLHQVLSPFASKHVGIIHLLYFQTNEHSYKILRLLK